MRRGGVILGAVLAAAALAVPAAAAPEALDGVIRTKRFEVRFRSGSRAAADAPRQAVVAERDLDRIAQALDAAPKGPFVLRLYDDASEIAKVTGTTGTGGFSAGKTSHVPCCDDQTRLHELVHVVAAEWPASGTEPRSLFFAEGLANAVLEFVSGVHVHAVAAHYARAGRLPSIAEMTAPADFYGWMRAHPGFDVYDVAASWMRFLLDAHGTAKVRRYYTGTPAKAALGIDVPAAEKAWRAMLAAYDLRPEVETLLRLRDGDSKASFSAAGEGVPPDLLGKPEDWTDLLTAPLSPLPPGEWAVANGVLSAKNVTDTWSACELGAASFEDCAVNLRLRTTGYTPVQVRFGAENQVLFVFNGTHFFRGDAGIGADPAVVLPMDSTRLDVFVARRGRRIEVWVDGRKALATDEGTTPPQRIGVGIHKGSAVFESARVRRLR